MTTTSPNRVSAERIGRDDIEAKFREIQGEVESTEQEARNYVGVAVAVVAVTAIVIAFALGRRQGRRRGTVVEVRRL